MQWPWQRIPEGVLDTHRQLGEDLEARVAAEEFAEIRRRMRRWQRSIGHPGDPVSLKLLAAIRAQQPSPPDPGRECSGTALAAKLEETRTAVASSMVVVTRAYLLTTQFVFKHSWLLDDLTQAQWVREFLDEARRYGADHNMVVETSFQAPLRCIGSFGWTGSARLRCVGTADVLQSFTHEVCHLAFVGLEPSSLREPFMEEIPTYVRAREAVSLIRLSDEQLRPNIPGSKSAEDRDRRIAQAAAWEAGEMSLRSAIADLEALADRLAPKPLAN